MRGVTPMASKAKAAESLLAQIFEEEEAKGPKPSVRATVEGGHLHIEADNYPVDLSDARDWSPLVADAGLNPEYWDVVEPVKIKKWQTSKGLEDGTRSTVWLWSYGANYILKKEADQEQQAIEADLLEAIALTQKWKSVKVAPKVPQNEVTYVHHQGDEQAGKSEGGSLEGLFERESETVQASLDSLRHRLKRGWNVAGIADLAAGDRIENIFGHYNSQARTTSTLRKQMMFARNMDIMRTRAFAEFGLPIHKVYTPSNHGEIRQSTGASPFTSESDNYDLMIAEQVQAVLEESPIADLLCWHIPHDEWWTLLPLSGVNIGLTHGHKVKAAAQIGRWVKDQRAYLLDRYDFKMQIAFTGHLHHTHIEDLGGVTLIQSPALDGGSPYFEASSGTFSHHGALSLLVSDIFRTGWNAVDFL